MRHGSESTRPPIVLSHGVYVLAFRILSRGYAALGMVLGLAVILGGPRRFSSRGLATAREIPGGYLTWGVLAALAGGTMLLASLLRRRRMLAAGTSVLIAWHLFFAFSLGLSAARDHQAGLTGTITYSGLAGLGWVLASALREADSS